MTTTAAGYGDPSGRAFAHLGRCRNRASRGPERLGRILGRILSPGEMWLRSFNDRPPGIESKLSLLETRGAFQVYTGAGADHGGPDRQSAPSGGPPPLQTHAFPWLVDRWFRSWGNSKAVAEYPIRRIEVVVAAGNEPVDIMLLSGSAEKRGRGSRLTTSKAVAALQIERSLN